MVTLDPNDVGKIIEVKLLDGTVHTGLFFSMDFRLEIDADYDSMWFSEDEWDVDKVEVCGGWDANEIESYKVLDPQPDTKTHTVEK